jgi:hypothetical protein
VRFAFSLGDGKSKMNMIGIDSGDRIACCRVCRRPGAVPIRLTQYSLEFEHLLSNMILAESFCSSCRDWTLEVAKTARIIALAER